MEHDGAYIFFDASGMPFMHSTITTCEKVPLGGSLQLRYEAYGRDIDTFEVQSSAEPTGHWETLFSIVGDQGHGWTPLSVPLGKPGKLGYVRLFYRNGRHASGDLTLDDVLLNTTVIASQSVAHVKKSGMHIRLAAFGALGCCVLSFCAFAAARKRDGKKALKTPPNAPPMV